MHSLILFLLKLIFNPPLWRAFFGGKVKRLGGLLRYYHRKVA